MGGSLSLMACFNMAIFFSWLPISINTWKLHILLGSRQPRTMMQAHIYSDVITPQATFSSKSTENSSVNEQEIRVKC